MTLSAEKRGTDRLQGELNRLLEGVHREAEALSDGFAAGLYDADEVAERFALRLEELHTEAVRLGRERAGDRSPPDEDDRRFAEAVLDREAEFLQAFEADLRAGRYETDGFADTARIKRRLGFYAGRLVGTANEAFLLSSEDETLFYWRLGGVERHCPDCPELAAANPHRADELDRVPGSCETQCKFRCKCRLERADGVFGFRIPEGI